MASFKVSVIALSISASFTFAISKFSFISFPYGAETEIHGFEYNKLNSIAGSKVDKVSRGGFFGGPKDSIGDINSIYYGLLKSTLEEGYMGTEESIFSIMSYKHSDLINYFEKWIWWNENHQTVIEKYQLADL